MSAKRGSLSGMLTPPPPMPPPPSAPPEEQAPELQTPVQQGPAVPRSTAVPTATPALQESRVRESVTPELPKYKRLTRKELLIEDGDLTRLTVLARALTRSHGGTGERITANTLIRVAVTLLLDRAGELAGADEEELRRSLRLPA